MKSPFQKMIERYKPEVRYYYFLFSDYNKAHDQAEKYISDLRRQNVITEYEAIALYNYNDLVFLCFGN